MLGPCQCGYDSDDRPTIADYKNALAQCLIEIDAYRLMLELPTFECRRTFTCQDLDGAATLGLVCEFRDGALSCWPES